MISISKIEFKNYRQYRDFSISFEKRDYNLFVIKAKNGTGKTTFLSGILWCLYGDEHFTSKAKTLEIINDTELENAKPNDKLTVEVSITLTTEESFIKLTRKQLYIVKEDFISRVKNVTNIGKSELAVSINYYDPKKNPDNYSGEEASAIVKTFFDEAIYKYYFFDGEKLQSYFEEQNTDIIKRSIFNISQIKLLEDTKKHIQKMADDIAKQAESTGIVGEDPYAKRDKIQSLYDSLYESNELIVNDLLPSVKADIEKYETQLKGYEPIKEKQNELSDLEAENTAIDKEYELFIDERNSFIREYMVLLSFYPRIKSTLELIHKKEKEGSLPPSIDKKQLKHIIDDHLTNCPVCDGIIGSHAVDFINGLLEKLEFSVGTATTLRELKVSLESLVTRADLYVVEKQKIVEKEKNLNTRKEKVLAKIAECKKYLINNVFIIHENGVEINTSEVEKKLEEAKRTRDTYIKTSGSNETLLKTYLNQLKEVNDSIDKIEKEKITKGILSKKVAVLREIQHSYEKIKENIMISARNEIEKSTWEIFSAMAWKKNTYSKVKISTEYEMSVYNINNREITGNLSGAETMALVYSFTLAIHKAAGKNCPLVVDSPLGRVSDLYRTNMAQELLRISKDKQIIMLFTPNEYSEEVSSVYDDNAAICEVCLNASETEVVLGGK